MISTWLTVTMITAVQVLFALGQSQNSNFTFRVPVSFSRSDSRDALQLQMTTWDEEVLRLWLCR